MDGDLLDYIKLGTDYKHYFNYDGQPLPLRPLSTYEVDKIIEDIIKEGITVETYESILKAKLHLLSQEEQKTELSISNYLDYYHYYNEIDYWTVFHAMKDFQSEKFTRPDYDLEFEDDFEDYMAYKPKGYYIVRKMRYVHEIAADILSMTTRPIENLIEILQNKSGTILATLIHRFHQPLSSKEWKLTPLQTSFIFMSRPGAPIYLEDESEIPGIKAGTLEEISKKLMEMGMTKDAS